VRPVTETVCLLGEGNPGLKAFWVSRRVVRFNYCDRTTVDESVTLRVGRLSTLMLTSRAKVISSLPSLISARYGKSAQFSKNEAPP